MRRTRSSGRSRAQVAVVGFVLMFGLVMLLMTILQVSAVPAWNQGEEFAHSQQIRTELELLHDDVTTAAATGRVTSESLALGLRYPRRPFLLNPGDPTGRIRTTDPGTVRLTNLTAGGETGDYWNGTVRTFTTRHLVYLPDYNEYDAAPVTAYEHGVLYDRYADSQRPVTAQRIVHDRRITLVTLNGTLSRTSTTTTDLAVVPVSAPQQVTTLEGTGPVRLRLPTRLDAGTWRDLLAEEFVAAGGHVYDNVTVTEGDPYDTVTITLEGDQSYDLRLAAVRLGSGPSDAGPHYVTTDSSPSVRLPAGSSERVVVEVRDRFNNPVSGVPVEAVVRDGSGTVTPVDATTDGDGHAAFRYTSTEPGTATVAATFGTDPGPLETATVTVESVAAGGGSGDGTGPFVSGVGTNRTTATDRSVQRGARLTLEAEATDFQRGGTDIYAVEWWSNRTTPGGGPGSGFALAPVDGAFDTAEEAVVASGIDTSGWEAGRHELSVRARDANGNWGPVATYEITVADTDTAATDATYVTGTAATNNADNRFRFDIEVGTESVTLRNASIDTTTLGGVRDRLRDLSVGGSNVRAGSGSYASDGTIQALTNPTVTGTTTVEFGNFDNGPGNTKLPGGQYSVAASEPAGDHLVVTLGFADGSQQTLYFVPP